MTRWLLLAFALGGCDQVLGLEKVGPLALKVNGTFRFRSVVNNSAFEPMPIEEILPVEGIGLEAFFDDGTETPLEYRADGSFSFPIDHAGQPYRVRFTAGVTSTEWQHTAPELAIGIMAAGRRDARPLAQTRVQFNYAPITAAQPAFVASTGIYTQTSTGMFAPTVMFDWRLASPTFGAVTGLLDAAENDRIYAYENEAVVAGTSPTYSRIRALSQASITQAQSTTALLPQLVAVPPNLCVRAQADGLAEKMRMTVTHPRMYTKDAGSWLVYSTPAPDWVAFAGAIHTGSASWVGVRAIDITPSLHDPFPGTTLVTSGTTALTFLVQLPGTGMAAEVANATRSYQRADRGTPGACAQAAIANLNPTIGLPGAFELDGEDLNFDNEEIVLDLSRPPTLSWRLLAEGPIDFTSVAINELQSINNVTTLVTRWSAITVGTSIKIDPAVLEVGRTYIFSVMPQTGRPNAATGDMRTTQLPIENATIYSYTFIVRE